MGFRSRIHWQCNLRRVNFLMGNRRSTEICPRTETLEIPVLLADAIYSPAPDPAKGQEVMNTKLAAKLQDLILASVCACT